MQKKFFGLVGPQVTLFGQAARPQPPMGLAYIFNAVEQAGWEPIFFDSLAEGFGSIFEDRELGIRVTGLSIKRIIKRIEEVAPDVIGLSLGLSTDHDYVRRLAQEIRATYQCPIILGGSEASLMHTEILSGLPVERIPANFVVTGRDIGAGEETVLRLLKELSGEQRYEEVPGLAFLQDKKVVVTSSVRVDDAILASLAMPRRDLFPISNGVDIYSSINLSHTGPVDPPPYAVMHTSRGCGAACTFCHTRYGGFDRTLIRRSLSNVFSELEYLRDRGVNTVSIEDDNFGGFSTNQLDFSLAVLEKVQELEFQGLYFPNGMTIRSMINDGFRLLRKLRELADAGLKIRSSLPAESGDDHTLRHIINKPHGVNDISQISRELMTGYLAHENIDLDVFFMIGAVGYNYRDGQFLREKKASMRKTLELADKMANLGIRVNIWWMKPNPNGPQYKLWRSLNPEAPFYFLQFAFPSGIWGDEEEELYWNEIIEKKNEEMGKQGVGSRRPIFRVR
ncbi:B12-binding domain-containing radical SAM protein [Patescibacteria group bacterium]|nr:B12-binding domain-containing radical SAM protein [Patescibacteria group bacterium]MBU1922464.1 B12-binding domain-containing radical SAM protein [Patescibacteria group bacterium]